MNNFTKTLAAILANTALVWGRCDEQPDADGLVTLPATWTKVSVFAFIKCSELEKVVIPVKITEISGAAFRSSGLEVIEFEAGSKLTSIGVEAFYDTPIVSIKIPQGVKEILNEAFAYSKIRSINIPQGVASFDANKVFKGTPCTNKNVFMPGNTVVNCKIITPTPSPTSMPTTAAPTTNAPTTAVPTTMVPTTVAPTTAGPTTAAPTTSAPTTMAPTTAVPTTMVPTTAAPTTAGPTTAAPTTSAPTLMAPTTAAPSTAAPTTMSPTEVKDTCVNLKKRKCRNTCVFSKRQRQCLPKSTSFVHNCAQYEGKTPCLENKVCKFPHGKCVHRCDGKNARRCRKHQFCNLDKVVNPCFGCHLVTACGPRR